MVDDIRCIRSYVLEEGGGSVGTVCIYQASSPEAIRRHADAADLPVDEIVKVADTVVVREDPPQRRPSRGLTGCPKQSPQRSPEQAPCASHSCEFRASSSLAHSAWKGRRHVGGLASRARIRQQRPIAIGPPISRTSRECTSR
jgi:hypothetical protein